MSATGTFAVRAARASDVDALARLSGELGYPVTSDQLSQRLQFIQSDREHALFVAENDAAGILGWVHVFRYRTLVDDQRAEILGLVSDPTARRRGVGRALMRQAEEWADNRGLKLISLRSNVMRTEAHLFYKQLGYTNAKTQFAFRKKI